MSEMCWNLQLSEIQNIYSKLIERKRPKILDAERLWIHSTHHIMTIRHNQDWKYSADLHKPALRLHFKSLLAPVKHTFHLQKNHKRPPTSCQKFGSFSGISFKISEARYFILHQRNHTVETLNTVYVCVSVRALVCVCVFRNAHISHVPPFLSFHR